MAKKQTPPPETVELDDSMWVRVGQHALHECCGCGMVHRVELKWKDTALWERWIVEKQPRRRRKK